MKLNQWKTFYNLIILLDMEINISLISVPIKEEFSNMSNIESDGTDIYELRI